MPIIREKVVPDSIVYTDGFKSYDVLEVSEFKHERIDHDRKLVDQHGKHINGVENLWNQAKRVLRKYNGIPRHNFELFLKGCESRFNPCPELAEGTAPQRTASFAQTLAQRGGGNLGLSSTTPNNL